MKHPPVASSQSYRGNFLYVTLGKLKDLFVIAFSQWGKQSLWVWGPLAQQFSRYRREDAKTALYVFLGRLSIFFETDARLQTSDSMPLNDLHALVDSKFSELTGPLQKNGHKDKTCKSMLGLTFTNFDKLTNICHLT